MAYYNKKDIDHSSAVESFRKTAENKNSYRKLYTSDYVLDEAITNCRVRTRNHRLSVQLGSDILSSKTIVMLRVDQDTLTQSWELYKRRGEIELSFTDCTIATLAQRQGIDSIYTYDEKHFGALGFHPLVEL